ncbi:hypothetical protein [Cytobacillus pseudoceanisediminis]|uniref:hypothetical protein n=1 Tax=Cytobacillus pseudoceanisediminis TaxID=3051614 RepID=UPI003C306B42
MSKTYTDYFNKTALTISESFIDVKTGSTIQISSRLKEQIEFHSKNQTLNHFILSALHSYLHTKTPAGNNDLILQEIAELRSLLLDGSYAHNNAVKPVRSASLQKKKALLDLNEVEDVLDAFGG